MSTLLIGIDDTDIKGSPGTGRQARELSYILVERGWTCTGVTRHQLYFHPDVPYTSNNSSACIGLTGDVETPADIFEFACNYIKNRAPEGSDPGVCVTTIDCVPDNIIEFGHRTTNSIVTQSEARQLGAASNFLHAGLGGTNDGMIGSLAAVGLRAGGNDGRFVEVGRIREFSGIAQVCALLDAGIDAVQAVDGETVDDNDMIDTLDWVRPRLLMGRPILVVRRSENSDAKWVVDDDRKKHRKANGLMVGR